MRGKSIAVASLVAGALALLGTGLASFVGVPAAGAASVTQTYSCAISGVGTENVSATVAGKAAIVTSATGVKTIHMTSVVYTLKNTFGISATINNLKVSVPDPNFVSAPYIASSAHVAATPPGWTAGHDATGAFALHAGSIVFANGATVKNAALRANYKDKGPKGTAIPFHPGQMSFNITAPIVAGATCTPSGTLQTFASVTE